MFRRSRHVLYLSRSFAVHAEVRPRAENPLVHQQKYTVADGKVADLLLAMKKERRVRRIRLLLDDELGYSTTFRIGHVPTRSDVAQRVAELLPEDLSELVWDWKVARGRGRKPWSAVVFALPKRFLRDLGEALKRAKIRLDLVEPVSAALARQTAERKEPHLIAWCGPESVLLLVAQNGRMFVSRLVANAVLPEGIESLVAFAKANLDMEVTSVVLAGAPLPRQREIIQGIGKFIVEEIDLNPILATAAVEETTGRDEAVLNLDLTAPLPSEALPKKPTARRSTVHDGRRRPHMRKSFLWAIVIFVIVGALVNGVILLRRRSAPGAALPSPPAGLPVSPAPAATAVPTSPVASPLAAPSPTVEPVSPRIEVFYVPAGEAMASAVAERLRDRGYTVEANAAGAQEVPPEVLLLSVREDASVLSTRLVRDLEGFTVYLNPTPLPPDSASPAILVVGPAEEEGGDGAATASPSPSP